jgi:hypothetical protein
MAQGENLELKSFTAPKRSASRREEAREPRPEWQSDDERQLSFYQSDRRFREPQCRTVQ